MLRPKRLTMSRLRSCPATTRYQVRGIHPPRYLLNTTLAQNSIVEYVVELHAYVVWIRYWPCNHAAEGYRLDASERHCLR